MGPMPGASAWPSSQGYSPTSKVVGAGAVSARPSGRSGAATIVPVTLAASSWRHSRYRLSPSTTAPRSRGRRVPPSLVGRAWRRRESTRLGELGTGEPRNPVVVAHGGHAVGSRGAVDVEPVVGEQ